jgi:hypothetical protein
MLFRSLQRATATLKGSSSLLKPPAPVNERVVILGTGWSGFQLVRRYFIVIQVSVSESFAKVIATLLNTKGYK